MFRAALLIAMAALGASPIAQDNTAARSKATELSRSWAAIGQGDYARAEQIAAALLRANPSDHSAIAVSLAATVGAGQPTAALDAYEQWLKRTRHEDVFLLQPIAAGTLAAIAAGDDIGLAVDALSKLAASDPETARGALGKRTDAGPEFDRVRAALGDKAAVTRLVDNLGAPSSREKLLALQAVAAVADIPATAIAPLLSDPAPPVRAAAAETLARVQGAAAVEPIKPLLADPDAYVRVSAAVALGRLGDAAGLDALTRMLASDAGDTVAMAAVVLKERGVDVSGAADRILADPNPLTRLGAIPLLADASRAQALLSQAASDPNPVVRARAGRILTAGASDLPTLRRLLRDSNPDVRLGSADALLQIATGKR
jgi:HEAT repeat protein